MADVVGAAHLARDELEIQIAADGFDLRLSHLCRIDEKADAPRRGNELVENFQSLAVELRRARGARGLTADFLADKPLFGAVAAEFLAFVDDAPLVAHNAGFDIAFLNAELERAGKAPIATG